MVKQRNFGGGPRLDRPPVVGLEPGAFYRRRDDVPLRVPGLEDYQSPPGSWPVVQFVEGAVAGNQHAGVGGWFYNPVTKTQHFYLAADVEAVVNVHSVEALVRKGADAAKTASDLAAEACAYCDKTSYSRGLCTTHYSRARKLVKEGGLEWDAAKEAMSK